MFNAIVLFMWCILFMVSLILAIRCPIEEDTPYDWLKHAVGSGVALCGIIWFVIRIAG